MVGISSMLRLVILAIVAIGMSHAAAVEADATAAAELKADTSVPHGYVACHFYCCTHSK